MNELSGRRVDDASPRGFLQLAEEHRREGRFEETVEVLREGLKQHPNHVAAQVALGRCWLELDRPEKARKILDKVVDQDMTHLVAAKLLVETHIRRSDPEQARRQVDLYSVLNNSDPDIEPLRKRIEALGGPQAQGAADSSAEMPETEKTAAKAPSKVTDGDIANGTEGSLTLGDMAEPFVFSKFEERQRLYWRSFADEELFPLSASQTALLEEPVPEPPAASAEEVAEEAVQEPPPEPEPAPEPAFEAVAEPEQEQEPMPAAEVAATSEPEEPVAEESETNLSETVTLGQLYLQQGHDSEASRIFREVLDREPGNEEAQEGLAILEAKAAALEAEADSSESLQEESDPEEASPPADLAASTAEPAVMEALGARSPGEVLERKKLVLNRYLDLLRQSPERDVS